MKNFNEIFNKYDFYNGRLICSSKSLYHKKFPDHNVLFNANIFIKEGKIFYGDIDLNIDNVVLQKICNELNEEFIVVRELYGRFGGEKKPYHELEKLASAKFTPNKNFYLIRDYNLGENFNNWLKIDIGVDTSKNKK